MSRDHWDAILASAPLNAIAGAVTSKGTAFEPEDISYGHQWDVPPPMAKISAERLADPSFVDLTGRVIGRLTVLGMASDNLAKGKGSLWVCRCKCGRYCGQRAKALKSEARDRCDLCDNTRRLAYFASGNNARIRAESSEAKKW